MQILYKQGKWFYLLATLIVAAIYYWPTKPNFLLLIFECRYKGLNYGIIGSRWLFLTIFNKICKV
ncbi:MAG: hypothetical protein EAZ15_06890 [Sphingobacteriales bacterium]|nr:MAG: hypothetical protein EAZ15_06890 [Sphingobacteriales bacterium]